MNPSIISILNNSLTKIPFVIVRIVCEYVYDDSVDGPFGLFAELEAVRVRACRLANTYNPHYSFMFRVMPLVAGELLIMRDESHFAHFITNQNDDEYTERYYGEFIDRGIMYSDCINDSKFNDDDYVGDSKFYDDYDYINDPVMDFEEEQDRYEMIQAKWEPDHDYEKFKDCDDYESYLDKFTRSKWD